MFTAPLLENVQSMLKNYSSRCSPDQHTGTNWIKDSTALVLLEHFVIVRAAVECLSSVHDINRYSSLSGTKCVRYNRDWRDNGGVAAQNSSAS